MTPHIRHPILYMLSVLLLSGLVYANILNSEFTFCIVLIVSLSVTCMSYK